MTETKIRTDRLSFMYNRRWIFREVSTEFAEKSITAIVGPSGCGKSTFLSTINRLWENIPAASMHGTVEIRLDGRFHNILARGLSASELRRRVGTVFQVPNPLPMSIYRNAAFPLTLAGCKDKDAIAAKVEQALKQVFLWHEVKDRLGADALSLSGGQQQRLCLARALILEPEVLLLDEPTSSLDTKGRVVIEDLLLKLKERCTLLVVSHYQDQVQRLADTVIELADGRMNLGGKVTTRVDRR